MKQSDVVAAALGGNGRARLLIYLAQHEDKIVKTTHLRKVTGLRSQYVRYMRQLEQVGLVARFNPEASLQWKWSVEPSPVWLGIRMMLRAQDVG